MTSEKCVARAICPPSLPAGGLCRGAQCAPARKTFLTRQIIVAFFLLVWYNLSHEQSRGYSSSVERQLPKLNRRVRLPLSAPRKDRPKAGFFVEKCGNGSRTINPTVRWTVGRRRPRRRFLCFAAGKTQTTPFIRSMQKALANASAFCNDIRS